MKNIFFCINLCMVLSCATKISTINPLRKGIHSTDSRGNSMLLGTWTKSALQEAPYNSWFVKNYNDYKVDSTTANQLNPLFKNKSFQIFLGTWCGDSKREVPRMLKLLDYCNVDEKKVQIVFVSNHDSVYKQSPFHEEKGKFIFHVPDLLVYENNVELGKIIESPVVSLEKDLLSIARDRNYEPNYKASAILTNFLKKDLPEGNDLEIAELVAKLKPYIIYADELNYFGKMLMNGGEYKKAIITFKVNSNLYPEDITAKERLAIALWKANDLEAAQKCCNEILSLYPGNTTASTILKTISN
ncbi:MAG: tetratricopeptide repeat protein [Sphingobacteriales bacterium]